MIVAISALRICLNLLVWLILIRCLLSFLPLGDNFITKMVYNLTEPLLGPIRELTNKSEYLANLPVDFSPMILILILDVVYSLL